MGSIPTTPHGESDEGSLSWALIEAAVAALPRERRVLQDGRWADDHARFGARARHLMKILIAEHYHPANRKLLRITLEVEGYGVIEAADGAQALLLLEREPVDAIISDILLPNLDGFRLCHEIRRSDRWRQLPFIFCAATYARHDPSLDERLALKLGGDVFLRQPVTPAAIMAALQAALKNIGRPAPAVALNTEAGLFKEYSERLVARLEAKDFELAQVNQELAESRARFEAVAGKLRALALRLETVREQERTTIAREIHDVLAQDLTRLKIDLVWLAKRLASPVDEALRPALVERIADATAQTDAAITHVQRIATELRPLILDSLGLPAAVEWQVEDFGRRTGLDCHAAAPGGELPLDSVRATALYRILQECLTNIARHAKASAVDVNLNDAAGTVTLSVHDNGRGITPAEIDDPRSIGLIGMCERAQAFGGAVQFAGAPGTGTTVTVRMPADDPVPP